MKKLCILLFLIAGSMASKADSPLTSTNFYTVFEEYDIVQKALDAKGKINNELMIYLSDRAYPIDVKVALINALGWNFDGQKNFKIYLSFLEMRTGLTSDQNAFYKKIDGDELLCLAYLKAMDNYFDVKEAKKISEAALAKNRRTNYSYTFNLIDALIGAQIAMDSDWCGVYKTTQAVKENPKLVEDFPEEAENIVYKYMDLYSAECK